VLNHLKPSKASLSGTHCNVFACNRHPISFVPQEIRGLEMKSKGSPQNKLQMALEANRSFKIESMIVDG
jgi:hypothetical protein